jgi:ABC-type arginine/histidine transport system permease subunit
MVLSAAGCLQRNDWVCGEYLTTRADLLVSSTVQHVTLTVVSVLLGLVLALPLGVLAFRVPAAALAGARRVDGALHDPLAGDVLAAAALHRAGGDDVVSAWSCTR